MAFVVLFTTMSFTVDMHYCGDVLVDMAVFKEVKSCGMSMAMENNSSSEMKKMGCCHDEQIIIEGQDELKTSFHKLDLKQQEFIVAFYETYIQLFAYSRAPKAHYDAYPPPDIVTDFITLHEQFLI